MAISLSAILLFLEEIADLARNLVGEGVLVPAEHDLSCGGDCRHSASGDRLGSCLSAVGKGNADSRDHRDGAGLESVHDGHP